MGDAVKNPKFPWPQSKWGIIVTLAAVLLGIWVWALRFSRQGDDKAWERILERGVITVATDASYPPFAAVDENGALFGFDIDLAEEIGRRLGVRAEFENIAYDALLSTLVSGRDDVVISAFVPQPARLREVSYTRPYFISGTAAVIRREGDARLTDDPALWASGKTLAVEYGAGGEALARRWARRAPGVIVLPRPTAADALQAVEDKDAHAALVDAVSAYEFLRAHPALGLAGPPLEPEPYVIAVSSQSLTLHRALENTLADMEADGALTELKVKWFGEAAR